MKKRIIFTIVLIEILAAILGIRDFLANKDFDGAIERPKAGELSENKKLFVSSKIGEKKVSVNVTPKKRSDDEIESLLDNAKEEINSTVIGENENLSKVYSDLNIESSYQNGTVNATWKFDNTDVISSSGKLNLKNITEKSEVRAFCTLECEDVEETYIFSFIVYPPTTLTKAGYDYLLNEALTEADEATKSLDTMVLPKSLDGNDLFWKSSTSNTGFLLAILGIIVVPMVGIAEKNRKRAEEKRIRKQLELDYPDIVSALSLYIGAGISVKGAIVRIASDYNSKVAQTGIIRPGFEGVVKLYRQMQDGKEEIESYKDFGRYMEQKDFRKLSIILVQNLRKGTTGLIEQLEKEEQQAFENRKLRAKIAGEEASTKLLIPMMALLSVVVIVLIFPAVMEMSI